MRQFKIVLKNFLLGLFFLALPLISKENPQLVVTIVIDQFAYHELIKLAPFLSGGLKKMYEHGVNFTRATHPHGMPETGPGHATIGTGALAKNHGIVANKFRNPEGKFIECDDDSAEVAAVISPDGFYNYGKSAKNIRVDTLADQLMLASYDNRKNTVFSLSFKSRAAIGMSGRLGKPIWFDGLAGQFTSSKAFFKELPDWVKEFNVSHQTSLLESYTWNQAYPDESGKYNFTGISDYQGVEKPETVVGKTFTINRENKEEEPFDFFMKTPPANKLLMDLATECIKRHKPTHENDRLIVNISLSGLDKIGHLYGPNSKEAIDMIYHMDQQLGSFMNIIAQEIDPQKTIYVLTADHGVSPIIEQLQSAGIDFAQIQPNYEIVSELNQLIQKKLAFENMVIKISMPFIYLNQEIMQRIEEKEKQQMYTLIKNYMLKQHYVQNIWTAQELIELPLQKTDLRIPLQNQLFHGRSGDLIVLLQPYNYFTKFKKGTTHVTPYDYDRHVPLLFYQAGNYEKLVVNKPVYVTQVAPTLAYLLKVPQPSACEVTPLPAIVPEIQVKE